MRIMIVESDWPFTLRATRYFESRGDLAVRQSPERMVGHARKWKPEVIVLAAEFVTDERMNALGSIDHAPAILLTEHMSEFARAWRAWQRGGDELLMKPVFQSSELQEAVVSAVEHATLPAHWSRQTSAVPA
jgi:ActR/RegA family two-component response regulator